MKKGVAGILSLIGNLVVLQSPAARAAVVFDSLFSLSGDTYATLVQSGNGSNLYGTTVFGNASPLAATYGTVFAAPTNGNTFPTLRPVFTNLFSFPISDGGAPHAGVIIGPAAYLYGTTAFYARSNTLFTNGMGSVFSLRTNGLFTLLYRFGTVSNSHGQPLDGASPRAPLVNGPSNSLYGTAYYGGTNGYGAGGLGFGTVFKLTTNGTLTELHSFLGSDGSNPTGLILGQDTNFYGVTSCGGSNTTVVDTNKDVGFGTIFKITTNGLLTTLYSFGAVTNAAGGALDGAQPNPLVQGSDGNFYGTTAIGGSNPTIVDSSGDVGYGTVFELSTNGALTTLYSFGSVTNSKGTPLDGANPSGPLVEGPDGNFYGVTQYGGGTNTGTIFSVTPAGALTTLHMFGVTNTGVIIEPPLPLIVRTGNFPRGGLLVGADQNLYGTTYAGGPDTTSKGSIFRLGPAAPDIVSSPATTTIEAGATFSFSVGVNTLYAPGYQWQFDGTNLADSGQVSGSATSNLTLTVLALTNSGTYTVIASNVAGSAKASGVLTVLPALISQQPAGGTIVYEDDFTFTVGVTSEYPVSYQWQFDGTNLTDGGEISGSSTSELTLSGAKISDRGTYSVTISNAAGVVQSKGAVLVVEPFETMAAPASLIVIAGSTAELSVAVQNEGSISYQWQFDGANLSDGGNMAGSSTASLTITNAVPGESGTYSVTVSNAVGVQSWTALLSVIPHTAAGYALSNLHSFNLNIDGGQPNGLLLGSDGALYGTTMYGGSNGLQSGTIFNFTTGGTLTTLYSFTGGSDQADPDSALVEGTNGVFYGTTASQVEGQYGTIFSVTTNGTFDTLATFNDTNGASPNAVAFGTDDNLYGTAYEGGTNGTGTIFSLDLASNALGALAECDAVTTGNYPYAGLTLGNDGNFYGTTELDVFQFNPTNTQVDMYNFPSGDTGYDPLGALLQTSNGLFYGTTRNGGTYGDGTLFQFSLSQGFTVLYSFGSVTNWDGSALDGIYPFAGLVSGPDGNLYGSTYSGGFSNFGTIFRVTTNGVLTTVAWLDGADGAGPAARLELGPNGHFYGTAQGGGVNGSGTIFQIVLPPPPPSIQSFSTAGGIMNMNWNVTIGQTYQLQYSADLSQGGWVKLNSAVVASGTVLNVSDSLAPSARFYRLAQLPSP